MPKKTTKLDKELRHEFCRKVWPCIGPGKRFRTQLEAALDIAISPQRLNGYLRAKATPSHHVLALISERWSVEFVVAGTTLQASQLRGRRATTQTPALPLQLHLFDKPEIIRNRQKNVSVKIERKSESILGFSIEVTLAK